MRRLYCTAAIAFSLLATQAQATLVTLSGSASNSLFDVVYDSTALGLFGAPQLANNVVFFTPTSFVANAQAVGATSSISSTVSLRIVPLAGYDFVSFSLQERGDFELLGNGSSVNAGGQFSVQAPANGPLQSRSFSAVTDGGPASGTSLSLLGPNSAYHGLNGTWNWRVDATLLASAVPGLADAASIDMAIRNDLRATAGALDDGFPPIAFIEKKFVGGSAVAVVLTPIPEPSSIALFAIGAGIVAGCKRRLCQRSEAQSQ
jgi:hypothetical protein